MDLELEAKQWMKERQLSSITATDYQARACETAIFPSTGPQSILLWA